MKRKVLVILTGGTICSAENEDGELESRGNEARRTIISEYKRSDSYYAECVSFDSLSLKHDILSENMTCEVWAELLGLFAEASVWETYDGIIVLHGTDTLAYTSAMLSLALSGAKKPVMTVSARHPLADKRTNGHINFASALELIENGIEPNVYAVYENSDGVVYAHYGSHLLQCKNYDGDFFSPDAMPVSDIKNASLRGRRWGGNYNGQVIEPSGEVLYIVPYVGLDYSHIDLSGVRAVLHTTYHSDTVCTSHGEEDVHSILYFIKKCKRAGVDIFLSPCDREAYGYATTGMALRAGAMSVWGMTAECAYAKLTLGCGLGYVKEELDEYMRREINDEFIYARM